MPLWLFSTPSRLDLQIDLISLRGTSCISLTSWSLERKCSETAVDLELSAYLSTGRLVSQFCYPRWN